MVADGDDEAIHGAPDSQGRPVKAEPAPAEALAEQLERLQNELTQLRDQQDAPAAPVAPWLARRGAARAPATRTLPPWLARRGRP